MCGFLLRLLLLLLEAFFIQGCMTLGDGPSDTESGSDSEDSPLYPKFAGFVSLPPRPIAFNGFGFTESGVTTEAEMFYSFVPSKTDAEDKPIFVFFNGGPGAATSSALAAWGTGPFTMTENGDIVANDADYSSLGSLIYIDTRQAGFSFDEMDNPSDAATRNETFNFINYNLYTDASDILITLLSVLKERPLIEDNPVVIVAESYGGARSAVLLLLARHASALGTDGAIFQDTHLKAALDAHYARISKNDPEAARAAQFERQILIQPGSVLPKSIEEAYTLYALCDHLEEGDPRVPLCDQEDLFDFSDLREPKGFFDARTLSAERAMLDDAGFQLFFGIGPEEVELFLPERRDRAFRFATEKEEGGANFNTISLSNSWDVHHITAHAAPYFSWQPMAYDAGAVAAFPFVRTLAEVHTLITNAYYDYAVDSSRLAEALLSWNRSLDEPMLVDAQMETDNDPDAAGPGGMTLTFAKTDFSEQGETRAIRMPKYLDSGHMVTMYQGADLLNDVREFLAESGL